MAYKVALADSAKADADRIYDWVVEQAPVRGPEWFEELINALYSLEQLPHRCPTAREAGKHSETFVVSCLVSAGEFTGFFTKSMRSARPFGFSTSVTVHGGIRDPKKYLRCRVHE